MLNNWKTAYPNAKEPIYNYDRMKFLENNTNYEFSNTAKIKALTEEVSQEMGYTFQNFESVFNDVGEGIKSGAKTLKYLPLIAIGLGGYILLKKTKVI